MIRFESLKMIAHKPGELMGDTVRGKEGEWPDFQN
jgi:hypothetical protein